MSKRLTSLIACLLLVCFVGAAMAEIFTASAPGFHGDVTVTLTIEGDTLTDVVIEGPGETPAIGGAAMEKLAEAMLAGNRVDVDNIASATVTTNAVLAAAAEALAASGATLVAKDVDVEAVVREDETTDVLIIGGGAAGLAAAVAACEKDVDVILVEKLAFLGGCSAMSSGVITRAAVETDGEDDMDADALYDFLMETADFKADPEMVRFYVDHSVEMYDWVYDMIADPTATSRYSMVPETIVGIEYDHGAGEMLSDMAKVATDMGADIRLEVSATELIMEDGRVVGAVVSYADGGEQKIYARGGVVMATGGFASSAEKLAQYSTPGAENIGSYASAGTVGDGIDMGQAVGAQLRFNEDWDTVGSWTLGLAGYNRDLMHCAVLLNDDGERFVDEANIPPVVYTAMRHQIADGNENGFWYVTGANIDPNMQWIVDNAKGIPAQNIEELAEVIGVSAEKLQATFDAYNAVAGTENDAMGKPARYNLGIEAPYTAIHNVPIRVTTIGGLVINTEAEVLDEQGSPIPGLYAGGEVANSNFYGTMYTCGTALGHALLFGGVAGANAAANVQ